jgi:SAM-dependent methyltransferase/uncharacterized protein YbaR (Trm112 family)
MNEWLLNHLVCPRDRSKLKLQNNQLISENGNIYPIVNDIPIMLVEEEEVIHGYITQTLELVKNDKAKEVAVENVNGVDEFVQAEIVYTSGNFYKYIEKKLPRYPIPEIRLPKGNGERLLDVGCNWGRWSIAAAQKGYQPVGIDPSLRAVQAAKRVSKQLGVKTDFVVGDARCLPFADNSFDVGYSFGVLQHFSKDNVRIALKEIARTVKKNHDIYLQMPNKIGIRSFYQLARRGFDEGKEFDIRYWTPSELLTTFREVFGETKFSADSYFGLGAHKSDVDLMPPTYQAIVYTSEFIKSLSKAFSPIAKVADSVYLESKNQNK